MDRLKFMKIANACLFFSFLTQWLTGFFIFLGMESEDLWEAVLEAHEYNGFALLFLIAVHVFLNWPIIGNHYFNKKKA